MAVKDIVFRPVFRAAGAEIVDIETDGKYAGTMTLAYREGERLAGAIQLDRAGLPPRDKKDVSDRADEYVHALADALRVEECEVLVTYGTFDHIVTAYDVEHEQWKDMRGSRGSEDEDGLRHRYARAQPETDRTVGRRTHGGKADGSLSGDRRARAGTGKGGKEDAGARFRPLRLELVIVGERGNRIEYHLYDGDKNWLAEAFCTVDGGKVRGEVNWMRDPDDEEMEAAADLVASDFDERGIEEFRIDMKREGELLETFELTHADPYPESDEAGRERGRGGESEFTAVLVRDDDGTLTYDIYDQTQGGLPVAQAAVDISGRRVTGVVDIRDPASPTDRENMAMAVLRELDKERDCDSLNLTMMHRDRRIENILFENEQIH
mgnify:CR=1 FL=1